MTAYYCTVTNGTGSGYHNAGQPFAISAIIPAGYLFLKWAGSNPEIVANVNNANTTATLYGTAGITATFTHTAYTIRYIANAGGSISGTTPQVKFYNVWCDPITAVADGSHRFTNWSDGNTNATRTDICHGDATYYANFESTAPPAPAGNAYPGYVAWFEVNND